MPDGFLFAARSPQEITRAKCLVRRADAGGSFVCTMELPGDRIRPLLLHLPLCVGVEHMDHLDYFLKQPPKLRYAVEVRHRCWIRPELPALLGEQAADLPLIDYARIPWMEETTTDFAYIRRLGHRRQGPRGRTHFKRDLSDYLAWRSAAVDLFPYVGRAIFDHLNNGYQNHSPETPQQFLEIRVV